MSVHLISVQLPVPDFSCYLVVLVVVWFFFCFIHLISPYWLGKLFHLKYVLTYKLQAFRLTDNTPETFALLQPFREMDF